MLWKSSSLLLVAARLLVFTVIVDCYFSRILPSRERGEQNKLKCHKTCLFSCFSWINTPLVTANFWLISRGLKKWVLTNFYQFFIAFMEVRIFGGPYSAIFTDITLRKKLCRSSVPFLPSVVTARGQKRDRVAGFQAYHRSGERWVEIRQVKTLQTSLFLLRLKHFSWIKTP